jgi:TPR repeat protein
MLYFGLNLAAGKGAEKDPGEAVKWFRKAAEAGNASAMNALGLALEKGSGIQENQIEATAWFRKAAESNDTQGMENLAFHFKHGIGVTQAVDQAVVWYRKAGDAGSSNALASLRELYSFGVDSQENTVAAVEWYRKAAEAGDSDAMVRLGQAYFLGLGIQKDQKLAAAWNKKAAELGNLQAMVILGISHLFGSGVPKDEAVAFDLFTRAAKKGSALGADYASLMKGPERRKRNFKTESPELAKSEDERVKNELFAQVDAQVFFAKKVAMLNMGVTQVSPQALVDNFNSVDAKLRQEVAIECKKIISSGRDTKYGEYGGADCVFDKWIAASGKVATQDGIRKCRNSLSVVPPEMLRGTMFYANASELKNENMCHIWVRSQARQCGGILSNIIPLRLC